MRGEGEGSEGEGEGEGEDEIVGDHEVRLRQLECATHLVGWIDRQMGG